MYWIISGFSWAYMSSTYGMTLGIGGIFGIIAWIYAWFVIRGYTNQMQAIGKAIQTQGTPPTPEQGAKLGELMGKLGKAGKQGVVFMILAVICMSMAQYL